VRIDLHTHSTASDGTDSPEELVHAAVAAGLDVIAITDHDTTAGWADAQAAAASYPNGTVQVLLGAEFSCVHVTPEGRRISMHVLGYLFDAAHPALRLERQRLRAERERRARLIVGRLAADGFPIDWDDVAQLAGSAPVGRPHIARALVTAGSVQTVDEAFAQLLTSRRGYYEPKADTPVLEGVALIAAAGGLPVFAHPLARRRGPVVDEDVVAAMVTAGLVGIEVDHPDHDADDRAEASGWAAKFGLVPTGSSDYHGANKTTPLGARTTDPDAFRRHERRQRATTARQHAAAPVRVHAIAAGRLRLPPPLPVQLPRSPDTAARPAVGAQQPRLLRPPRAEPVVPAAAAAAYAGGCRAARHPELAEQRLSR
jgi:hypothetical protein